MSPGNQDITGNMISKTKQNPKQVPLWLNIVHVWKKHLMGVQVGNAEAIQCMIFTDFLLTFLFGVSLGPFRDFNCPHIFDNNMFLKLSKHDHGAVPKLIICSAALPPTKPCNYSCLWQPQAIPSSFWYFPVEGGGVSYSFIFQ